MKVEKKLHTTIIKDTQGDVLSFLKKITTEHNTYKNQNLIIDITHDKNVTLNDIKAFLDLSKIHKKAQKSFIIVANVDFNATPKTLLVVPSLQEASDIIEMEEIERDLGF